MIKLQIPPDFQMMNNNNGHGIYDDDDDDKKQKVVACDFGKLDLINQFNESCGKIMMIISNISLNSFGNMSSLI